MTHLRPTLLRRTFHQAGNTNHSALSSYAGNLVTHYSRDIKGSSSANVHVSGFDHSPYSTHIQVLAHSALNLCTDKTSFVRRTGEKSIHHFGGSFFCEQPEMNESAKTSWSWNSSKWNAAANTFSIPRMFWNKVTLDFVLSRQSVGLAIKSARFSLPSVRKVAGIMVEVGENLGPHNIY